MLVNMQYRKLNFLIILGKITICNIFHQKLYCKKYTDIVFIGIKTGNFATKGFGTSLRLSTLYASKMHKNTAGSE